jgi:MFS transporter, DHA1 family, inner membrane transport protein
MPADTAPRPAVLGAPRRDTRILLLALGTFALGTDVFVIAGILRLIAAGLAVSTEAAGQLATAYALTYALGSPLLAAATARWRRERVVVLALGGFATADVICALAPNYGVLLAARILAGASGALFSPTAYGMAAALAPPERRGAALATVALGMTIATVFGAPLGTWIGHAFGWRASFLLGALFSAVAATALAMASGAPTPLAAVPRLAERFSPLARPEVLLSLVANWLWSAGNYTIYNYSAVIFGSRLHLDNIMWLLACYGVGGVAGSQLGGRFVDRFGTVAPIILCVGINAANLTLLNITAATAWGAGVVLFILAFAGWAVFPAQQTRLLQLEPAHGGLVLSLISSSIYIGSATGAALGGLLLARFPPAAPAYVAGAITVSGLLVFIASLVAARRKHRSMRR